MGEEPQSGHRRTLHLHIGLPKTASTWLQTEVFPELDHLRYLAVPESPLFRAPQDGDRRVLAGALRRSSRIWRDFGDPVFEELLGARGAWLADGRDLLLSEEGIGRQGSRPALLAAHLGELARKAADWGMARLNVVCVIRRQDHWIASHYAQVSDRNPRAGQADFEALVARLTDAAAARYGFGMLLDYRALREHVVGATGAENFLMLPYEALAEAPADFVEALLAHLDTPAGRRDAIRSRASEAPVNVRSGDGRWRLRPRRFRLGQGDGGLRLSLPSRVRVRRGRTIALTPAISRRMLAAYAPGNRRLAAAAGLDLARYGYIPPPPGEDG